MRLLKLPAVVAKTTKSKSSIYPYMRAGKFPLPIPTGKKGVAWLESEIDEWIAARIIPPEDRLAALKARTAATSHAAAQRKPRKPKAAA
jgi:prophage regulatory protein